MEIDQEIFDQNLLLTQAYCELQLQKPFTDNVFVFRTINPDYEGEPIFTNKPGTKLNPGYQPSGWNIDPLDNFGLYEELFDMQLRVKKENIKKFDQNTIYKGRILVAEIDTTTCDGASADESKGFIDGYDCPPIDSWFYLTNDRYGRVLLAWVPQQYVEIVDSAIIVNPLDSFNWYSDSFFEDRKKGYERSRSYGSF